MQADTSELRTRIRGFLQSNFLMGGAGQGLADGDSLLDSGIVDSTGVLEIVDFLQATWDLKVADEEMRPENLDSVDNLAGFVSRKLSAK
jgi:acyl carrier protein